MTIEQKLQKEFFARRAATVAPELLGRRLIRVVGTLRLVGLIAEVGAYEGGRKSLAVAPGVITVEVFQGGNRVLCIGTQEAGVASVVTIRRLLPIEGFVHVLDGPEKIVERLRIEKTLFDGESIDGAGLWIEGEPSSRVAHIAPDKIRRCAPNCVGYWRLA